MWRVTGGEGATEKMERGSERFAIGERAEREGGNDASYRLGHLRWDGIEPVSEFKYLGCVLD